MILKSQISKITRTPLSWREELNLAAVSIRNSTDKPLWLSLSGGIDSEIMAMIFLECNIPFTAIMLKHAAGTNMHDIQYAIDFCENNHVPYIAHELDMEYFCNNLIDQYIAKGYKSIRPFTYQQLHLFEVVEQLGGCLVAGAGDRIFRNVDNEIHVFLSPGMELPDKWMQDHNSKHFPYFFSQTPELSLAYINMPIINDIISNLSNFPATKKFDNFTERAEILKLYFPNIPARPKYTGWELLTELRSKTVARLVEQFPYTAGTVIPVTQFIEMLSY